MRVWSRRLDSVSTGNAVLLPSRLSAMRSAAYRLSVVASTVMMALAASSGGLPTGSSPPLAASATLARSTSNSHGCDEHRGRELIADDTSAPVRIALHRSLRFRLIGSGDGFRWTQPESSNVSMVGLSHRRRCPDGAIVGRMHALARGSAVLSAADKPLYPDPPTMQWTMRVIVMRRVTTRATLCRRAAG
jgi:hypothetical protein